MTNFLLGFGVCQGIISVKLPILTLSNADRSIIMDKGTKFALLVVGVPLLGAAYCALMLGVMFAFADARQHPIITATVFVLAPSLVSGSIWLFSSFRAKNKKRLGL
jgi:hypothetical protein